MRLVDVDTGLRGNAGPVLVVSEGSRCSVLVAGLVSAFFFALLCLAVVAVFSRCAWFNFPLLWYGSTKVRSTVQGRLKFFLSENRTLNL